MRKTRGNIGGECLVSPIFPLTEAVLKTFHFTCHSLPTLVTRGCDMHFSRIMRTVVAGTRVMLCIVVGLFILGWIMPVYGQTQHYLPSDTPAAYNSGWDWYDAVTQPFSDNQKDIFCQDKVDNGEFSQSPAVS